jgi:pimeloyl-ACP methyl ester carboxylesterase
MFVEIDGARIFFDTVGAQLEPAGRAMAERPALLILHGGPGFDHSLMRPWFDRFADAHQVVYVDHRGNGRSSGDPETWTLDRWGDDIAALCRILGVEKPVVFGLSFGGMVAMSYASRHPQGPSKLILSSTAARLDLQATSEMMERLGGPEARRIAEQFWSDPSPEVMAEYLAVCMPLYNPSGALGEEARARAIVRPEVMFHFIRGEQRTMDLRPGLKRVECPTLITAGALDPITPVACSEDILAALPPGVGELLVFDEAGHGVHRDLPDRAEAALRRFLAA